MAAGGDVRFEQMSGRTGRVGLFWLLNERDELPLRKGKNSHQFQQSWHIICGQKSGKSDSGLLLGPLILSGMRAGESPGVKYLWQWAQEAQWRGLAAREGKQSDFSLGEVEIRKPGSREQTEEAAVPLVAVME